MAQTTNKYLDYINKLTSISMDLSAQKDHEKLLETIVLSAMDLTNADGGTLYLVIEEKALSFEIVINKSLEIKTQHLENDEPLLPPILLYNDQGHPNLKNVVSYCYLQNQTVQIDDAYKVQGYDFSGMKEFDRELNYHSQSFLTIPLRNHENKTIGVLQLLNALDEASGAIIPFSDEKIQLAESLASYAAITLTQKELIAAQKNLFNALIRLIAKAIDEKSKYTSRHCERVPVLTAMIAEAAIQATSGYYKDFDLTPNQLEELRVAAWLHDCGKIVTPVHIVDKATKLETITDRIEVIELRLEVLLRDLKIQCLEKSVDVSSEQKQILENDYFDSCKEINEIREFLKTVNLGGEFLAEEDKEKIRRLAKKTFSLNGVLQHLLSAKDVENLCISRGTLNEEDRAIIQNHAAITHEMLSLLPYPDHLKNVAAIAAGHHERMDGHGYPENLAGDTIPIQARMLAIADVFEALTATDRPYKATKKLTEVLKIMAEMKDTGHIDPELFDLFIKEKIYMKFAKQFLLPEQIDIE